MKTRTILATAFITLAAVSCDDLPSGDITSPHYWGDVFLDKYEEERQIGELEPGPTPLEEPRTVLLITGVTIPAEWFDPIAARLERDGFNPVVYEPPDLLSGDLFENSERLAAVVDKVRADSGEDKIDILAECTGGVIARHYIQSLGGDAYVSRMVTFISPQHGVAKAPMAAKIAGWPALYDLSPGSDFLEAVNNAPLPDNVPFTSIYTCTDEYIQPYQTSIIPGAKNIGLCDGFVGHYEFFYNPDIYLIMHEALTEPLPSDVEESSDAPESEALEDASESVSPDDGDDAEFEPGPNGCAMSSSPSEDAGAWLIFAAMALALRRRRTSA